MLKVADVMTESVLTLAPTESLSSAAQTLSNFGVSGAPVCDAAGAVVGVFSKSDVVDRLVAGAVDLQAVTVGELMSADPVTIASSASVQDAARLITEKRVHRVVVLEGGKLVGILSPLDLVRAQAEGRLPG